MSDNHVFKIIDNSGRKIHLSKRQWTHIRKKHPEITNLEILKEGIEKYDKIINQSFDPSVQYFYKYYKSRKTPNQFLYIVIKYLNGTGYIITAYFGKKPR